jgi:hypothetical protein
MWPFVHKSPGALPLQPYTSYTRWGKLSRNRRRDHSVEVIMPRTQPTDDQLRSQIEAVQAEHYSTTIIEDKIAQALMMHGRFKDKIDGDELATIMRNIVYSIFAGHKIGGRQIDLLHNVPTMKVQINNSQAAIGFIVHIHKPIVAFIKFQYTLINDPVSLYPKLRVKQGSLTISEHTRRFDIKAKAALATINVRSLALKELADPATVINDTLPAQLERFGARGNLKTVELALKDHHLEVYLEGEFKQEGDW